MLPVIQGRHDGKGRIQSADRIAYREAAAQRVEAFVPVDRHDTRESLDDLVVSWLEGLRSALPETGDGAVDQAGIDFCQLLVRKSQATHHRRPEILHQHVRGFNQPGEDLFAFCRFQVEGQRFLVGVLSQETGAHQLLVEFGHIAQLARQVAALRIFDLDYIRAQQRQVQRGKRPGQHVGHVQDADTFQQVHSVLL